MINKVRYLKPDLLTAIVYVVVILTVTGAVFLPAVSTSLTPGIVYWLVPAFLLYTFGTLSGPIMEFPSSAPSGTFRAVLGGHFNLITSVFGRVSVGVGMSRRPADFLIRRSLSVSTAGEVK